MRATIRLDDYRRDRDQGILTTSKQGEITMYRFFALTAAVALVAAACTTSPTDAPHEDEIDTTSSTTVTTTAPGDDDQIDEDSLDGDGGVANKGAADDDHVDQESADDGQADGDPIPAADRTVEVLMTEFAFDVNPFEVTAGETIEFIVTNAGVIEHEFRVSNEHRIEEHLASGHDDHDDDDEASGEGGHEETGDFVLLLDAGETGSIVVTFPEDIALFTDVVCLLPGHYEAGMAADVRYTA